MARVHIVGAGLAGLAAAVRLAARGREVALESGTEVATTLATPFYVQAPVQ